MDKVVPASARRVQERPVVGSCPHGSQDAARCVEAGRFDRLVFGALTLCSPLCLHFACLHTVSQALNSMLLHANADVLQLHCASPFFPLVATAAHAKNVLEYHSEQADLSAE